MIDWNKPLEFTYHTSTHIKHPARLLAKDFKNATVANQTYVIAVTVGDQESIYTVTDCGCGAKGMVANGKTKKKAKILVYTDSKYVYSSNIDGYTSPEEYLGYGNKAKSLEIIEREYEV